MAVADYKNGWDQKWRPTVDGLASFYAPWWLKVLSRTYTDERKANVGRPVPVNWTALGRDPSYPIAGLTFCLNQTKTEVWIYASHLSVKPDLILPTGDPGMVDVLRTYVDLTDVTKTNPFAELTQTQLEGYQEALKHGTSALYGVWQEVDDEEP